MKIVIRRPKENFAVLIPTRGRPDQLAKTLEKQPFLHAPHVYIRYHERERKMYRPLRDRYPKIEWIESESSLDNGCVAREDLRRFSTDPGYHWYVPTDDNARYTEQSLRNLIASAYAYPKQPCIVSGFHGTAPHFDAGRIKTAKLIHGFHYYEKWGAIFWAVPHDVYSHMSYPVDGGRMDDRFVSFAALRRGCTNWVVCMEAPFNKATRQKGGYSASGRTLMMGQSVVALARDYPEYMEKIVISFPWKRIVEKVRADGGRKES